MTALSERTGARRTVTQRLVDAIGTRAARHSLALPPRLADNPGSTDEFVQGAVDGTDLDTRSGSSRRGFLGGAALVGAALAVDPWGYLVTPASAYDAVCGPDAACADGYSVFCCTINNGSNSCPPNSFIGGWWKADNASFCGGTARYYVDCNAFRNGAWQCRCASGTCDQRRVACNQFRYGQCSLEVPASNTGPVVCRIVSCAPPWQQFGGTCTSSSATDNRTVNHTAPCVSGRLPVGSLDVVAADGNGIRAVGWTYDPDQPATEIQVAIYLDGNGVAWFPTGRSRPDVNGAFGITGNHGFDITVPTSPGRHTVTVFAINIAGAVGNPVLGSGSATVGSLPVGCLDGVQAAPNGQIHVSGWAYDPDEPGTEIAVDIYRDGVGVARFGTGRPRPDVNAVFGIPGSHGFDLTFDTPPGDHSLEVYAINVGGGFGNPVVGRGQVRVGIAMGSLDRVAAVGRTVYVQGWAFDPDQPGTAIQVAVYRNREFVGWFPTGGARPDVNSVFGITGSHGFSIPVPSPPGRQTFDVYAINVGPAAGNPFFGAMTVDVA